MGHNFATVNASCCCVTSDATFIATDNLINFVDESTSPTYDGFSISTGDDGADVSSTHQLMFSLDNAATNGADDNWALHPYIGSLAFGSYYDFPHSPDLNLTMTIENDGITTQQTKGGATLTNALYTGSPKWGDLGAWELQSYSADAPDGTSWSRNARLGARTGRRSWNLTFSYLSDKETLPINALGNTVFDMNNSSSYDSDDYTEGSTSDYFNSNVLDGEDFFSSVWNKTMGGHLPFIFQPNKDNANPDQFAICRFDMESLEVEQVAYNTYTISLKIRECW